MLDISQSTYSKLESESLELNVNRLYKIAEILDINVYDILPPSKQSAIAAPNFFQKTGIRTGLFIRKKKYKTAQPNSKKILNKTKELGSNRIVIG